MTDYEVVEHEGRRVTVKGAHTRMSIEHEGVLYDPFHPLHLSPASVEVIEHGTYLRPDGEPMSDGEARRVRMTLLGRYAALRHSVAPTVGEAVRSLIVGLWRWGSIPMLGGNPKAGKSHLAVELIAALVIPGWRFLGIFPPVELTEAERARGVWLINAENPREELHEALVSIGLGFEYTDDGGLYYFVEGGGELYVEHLEDLGGADKFDLTDTDSYDEWAGRFMWCPCDGTRDHEPPLAVIVDGVTAILGSKTERYGEWYAAFRRLMRELDVPNALGVAHNGLTTGHLMNGVESMAGPDGLWSYSSNNSDDPNSTRYFSVVPRLGGPSVPRTQVVKVDGRLVMKEGPAASADTAAGGETDWEAAVVDRLAELPEWPTRTEVTGSGRYGQERAKALGRLIASGVIITKKDGLSTRVHLSDSE